MAIRASRWSSRWFLASSSARPASGSWGARGRRQPGARTCRRGPPASGGPFRARSRPGSVGRERQVDAVQFQITQPGGYGQDIHLPSGVVDVVLAGHVPAGEGEQAGERSPVGGAAPVADVKRPGGVGGNELDLDLPAAAQGRAPVFSPAARTAVTRRSWRRNRG